MTQAPNRRGARRTGESGRGDGMQTRRGAKACEILGFQDLPSGHDPRSSRQNAAQERPYGLVHEGQAGQSTYHGRSYVQGVG